MTETKNHVNAEREKEAPAIENKQKVDTKLDNTRLRRSVRNTKEIESQEVPMEEENKEKKNTKAKTSKPTTGKGSSLSNLPSPIEEEAW